MSVPLLIILTSVAVLLLIPYLLVRLPPPTPTPTPIQASSKPLGKPLLFGLSITGLDERSIERLKTLLKNTDISVLTTFLAFNRPGIVELDAYLQALQTQTDQHENLDIPAAPTGIHIDGLSTTQHRTLLRFDQGQPRQINRQLMARFGSQDFIGHFRWFRKQKTGVTLHIPPANPERKRFEVFTETGIALQGRQIPLAQRLMVLKMHQLRQMNKDLKHAKKYSRKADAAMALATISGAAVLLSMHYATDDLFLLNPLDEDLEAIEQEWSYLDAYATLLASVTSKARPLAAPPLPDTQTRPPEIGGHEH